MTWRVPDDISQWDDEIQKFSGKGVLLGREIRGNVKLPRIRGKILLPWELFFKHILVLGSPGEGKTETLMKIIYTIGQLFGKEVKIFFIDAKADFGQARRFYGLTKLIDREPMFIPGQHINGFRGDPAAVAARLNQVIPHAKEGPATWYRDIAEMVVRIVCLEDGTPPKSSKELLERFNYMTLSDSGKALADRFGLSDGEFFQVLLRYGSLFGDIQNRLDGSIGFEDIDTAYLMLSSIGEPTLSEKFAKYIFADLTHYLTKRKDPDEIVLLVIDEFPGIAEAVSLAKHFEQLRTSNVCIVLAAQSMAGIGSQLEQERYLGATNLVVAHAGVHPETIALLAGMKETPVSTWRYGSDELAERMVRREEKQRVTVDETRKLPIGQALTMWKGDGSVIRVERAPRATAPLPPEDPLVDVVGELANPDAAPMQEFEEASVESPPRTTANVSAAEGSPVEAEEGAPEELPTSEDKWREEFGAR
jgi:hypothetical protein